MHIIYLRVKSRNCLVINITVSKEKSADILGICGWIIDYNVFVMNGMNQRNSISFKSNQTEILYLFDLCCNSTLFSVES